MQIVSNRTLRYIFLVITIYLSLGLKAQNEVKIMPLGNSITVGYTDGVLPVANQTSYRFGLYYQLLNAGYDFDFVGSEISGWNYFTDCQHAGINGFRDQQMVRLLTDGYDSKRGQQLINPPGPYLDAYEPDIILMHIGTNDVTHEGDPGTAQISLVLDLVDAYELRSGKEVTVFLGLIINRLQGSSGIAQTTNYNNQLRTMAQARIAGGDKIVIVDMENDAGFLYTATDMTDWLHPNSVGYNKMSMLWFNSIKAYFNQAPVISPAIPNQTITQGESFAVINLDDYVTDLESADENITWTTIPPSPVNLNISINGNRQATISVKNGNWFGNESVIFRAEDEGSGGGFVRDAQQSVTFTVNELLNDPPVINPPIPDQTAAEGAAFNAIDLDFHVSDSETPDSEITWSVTPTPENFTVSIDGTRQALIIPKDPDWNGSEIITFKAEDNGVGGLFKKSDTDNVLITVTPVNDPPQFTSTPEELAMEDSRYTYVAQASDLDNPSLTFFEKDIPGWMTFDPGTRTLTGTPENSDTGTYTVIISVTDGFLETDQAYSLMVQNVNDVPVIVGMTRSIKISKNIPVRIELSDLLVEDPDNTYPDDFSLSLLPGQNYAISGTLVIPGQDYIGNLVVPVQVFDGTDISAASNVNVQVVLSTGSGPDQADRELSVYPNPSNGIVYITLPEAHHVQLEFLNNLGSVIFQKSYDFPADEISVDLNNHGVEPGVYIYQVRYEDIIKTGKVIVQ